MNAAQQWFIKDGQAPGWPRRHLIDVNQYYQMAEVGLLAPDARVELIEGEVVDMAPIGSWHADMVERLAKQLMLATHSLATVRIQGPIRLSTRSEPQPDLALLKLRPRGYRDAHPGPVDVLLVIEVSDSTLKFDLGDKANLHAQHEIPEYWVVDLENTKLHCHREPHVEGYRSITTFTAPQVLHAQGLPIAQVDLAQLFN